MHNSIKILIVDDVIVNRMTIKLSLKNDGYTFIEAQNGEEAIKQAIAHKPDVILMDAVMPVMDGFEATKNIRAIAEIERTPILMVTSLDDKRDKIKALEIGVNDFISKPFDKAELKARCKSYSQISTLNKKYSLATINQVTKLPNKVALLKDITEGSNLNELFLIKIDNFDALENFYGTKIVEFLENKFVTRLKEHFAQLSIKEIYHVSSGKYGILLESDELLKEDKVKEFCFNLVENIKNTTVESNGYNFDVNITMSFASSTKTLYEDANEVLSSALSQKKEYLLSSDVITDLRETLKTNLQMINEIKSALKNDRIFPYFQPIFDNKTKKIYKYESLIRMVKEDGSMVYPGPYFLDIAKKGKLYPQITKVLVEKVFSKIRESGQEFSMNLSSLDIEDPHMSAFLLNAIKKNADIADKLIVELLEDKDTQDYEVVKSFITISKKYGIKIAIDDFGSGYSNFMRILEFEPDIIKIDGSLIEDIATSKLARNTVEMIKIFADKVGALTVAEYIENEEIYDIVNEIGIDFSQGYYIGKAEKELVTKALFQEELVTS
jgi:EAL domain-containing protein (putative c-di-GMP-specific phosphodiesterase class I)/DNA-binding NarL/FixJ family response regulator